MKSRQGFVSNSSSSSFVIRKRYFSEYQIHLIKNNPEDSFKEDPWYITEDEWEISGYTSMDNYDMAEYLEKIGVDLKNIKWEY